MTPIEAARTAAREGRHVMALKLATMAVYKGDFAAAERGRALRVHLLATIESATAAREEAEVWIKNVKPAPAIAWALLGKQRFACDAFGAAIAAYQEALKIDPNQATVRIRCAELLMKVGREGQASTELLAVLDTSPEERILLRATNVLEQLVTTHASNYRDDQVEELLRQFERIVPASAGLLIHRARIAAIDGNKKQAEADFARAQKLEPNREDYAKLQRLLKPERSSWWQW
jgi:tetratricopeptide (TPR) repeat protein